MDSEVFDTRSLPVSQQFDAWQQWYGPIFDTSARRPVLKGFPARSVTWRLNGFAFSRTAAPAIDGWREPAHIRRNPVDHWVITLTKRGVHKVLAKDNVVESLPGIPLVQSLADPMASKRSSYDRLQLHMARDDFSEIAAVMDAVRNVPLDGPTGKLLAEYMLLIERSLSSLQKKEGQALKDALEAMVAACVKPTADRMAEAAIPLQVSRLGLIRRSVERHLQTTTFDTTILCREVGMSRSQLYRLLEGEGGVARYIKRKRLAAAYSRLCDVTVHASISKIAYELCFQDASSFSRAFRQEFGLSPTDVRAVSKERAVENSGDQPSTVSKNFGDLMRNL